MEKFRNQELSNNELEMVSGGAFGDWQTCPVCGKPKREGYLCIHCEMADGVVTCHRCRGKLTRKSGCSNCGATWEDYAQTTAHLRG